MDGFNQETKRRDQPRNQAPQGQGLARVKVRISSTFGPPISVLKPAFLNVWPPLQ
jgi:hypothetical protein